MTGVAGVDKVSAADIPVNRRRGGDIRVLLSPATVGATSGFSGLLTLAPGEYVSEHYHPYSEEFLHVVVGEVAVLLGGPGGRTVELGPGDALLVPRNVRHRVAHGGAVEARVIFHLSPLAPRPDLGHVDTEPLPGAGGPHPAVGSTGDPR